MQNKIVELKRKLLEDLTTNGTNDIIDEIIRLRRQNYDLKEELSKELNFRKINEIENKKLKDQLSKIKIEFEEIKNTLNAQKEELFAVKTRKELFEVEDLKELIYDFENDEWNKNTHLYGKYITVLKFDNKEKDALINILREEVKKLRDENIKEIEDIKSNLSEGLPLPGKEFNALSDHQKVQIYGKLFIKLKEYKSELDSLANAMNLDSDKFEEQLHILKSQHQKEIRSLEAKIKLSDDNKHYQDLYKAALERVHMLDDEVKLQGDHLMKVMNEKVKIEQDYKHEKNEWAIYQNTLKEHILQKDNFIEDLSKQLKILEHKISRRFLCMSCWEKQGVISEGDKPQDVRPRSNSQNKGFVISKSKETKRGSTTTQTNDTMSRNEIQRKINSRSSIRTKNQKKTKIQADNGTSQKEEKTVYDYLEEFHIEEKRNSMMAMIVKALESQDFQERDNMIIILSLKMKELDIKPGDLESINAHELILLHLEQSKLSYDSRKSFFLIDKILNDRGGGVEITGLDGRRFNWDHIFNIVSHRIKISNDSKELTILLSIILAFLSTHQNDKLILENSELILAIIKHLYHPEMKTKVLVALIMKYYSHRVLKLYSETQERYINYQDIKLISSYITDCIIRFNDSDLVTSLSIALLNFCFSENSIVIYY